MLSKRFVHWVKDQFPKIYHQLVVNPLLVKLITELDRPRFILNLLLNRPYIGPVYLSEQVWPIRRGFMEQLALQLTDQADTRVDILEIGSYAGDSTMIWAGAIRDGLEINGEVVCIDSFDFTPPDIKANSALHVMHRAQESGAVLKLFRHNMASSGCDRIVNLLVETSEKAIPELRKREFDLIYLDASHTCDDVTRDLSMYAPLVRQGGILCGDDLELQYKGIDMKYAEDNKNSDMVYDPVNHREYHPGVTLAVKDFFGSEISCYSGFWVMRKQGDEWQEVLLAKQSNDLCARSK
jgi:predicted O-methyltransferase YrrM